MDETFSDMLWRTTDAEKRPVCMWCSAKGQWDLPVTEISKGETLTVYCCSVEHQVALEEALR